MHIDYDCFPPCFRCPVYSVIADSEGNVNYHGKMFVYKSGQHRLKISKKIIEQLNDLVEEIFIEWGGVDGWRVKNAIVIIHG